MRHPLGLTNDLVRSSGDVGGDSDVLGAVENVEAVSERRIKEDPLRLDVPQEDAPNRVADLAGGARDVPADDVTGKGRFSFSLWIPTYHLTVWTEPLGQTSLATGAVTGGTKTEVGLADTTVARRAIGTKARVEKRIS